MPPLAAFPNVVQEAGADPVASKNRIWSPRPLIALIRARKIRVTLAGLRSAAVLLDMAASRIPARIDARSYQCVWTPEEHLVKIQACKLAIKPTSSVVSKSPGNFVYR